MEMKNHDNALLSLSLHIRVPNEQMKMVRADKMDEPVDCLPASDHLPAYFASQPARFAWFLIKDAC